MKLVRFAGAPFLDQGLFTGGGVLLPGIGGLLSVRPGFFAGCEARDGKVNHDYVDRKDPVEGRGAFEGVA